MDKFNLVLSLVVRHGGHLAPRTHRGKERFLGMIVAYALIQMAVRIAEKSDEARVITKARVTELIMDGGACTGCVLKKGGGDFRVKGESDRQVRSLCGDAAFGGHSLGCSALSGEAV